jgi:DNA repair exonuclease SbcCD ATPase subunit
LFGNTIRDIKKDKVIHNHTKKTCSVTLFFEVSKGKNKESYKLVRSLEPSKVSIFKDDEDVTLSTMPKTDELIKQIIGANEEVFQNAVIMTANNTMPFMAQKKIDKRKFVEGILNLGIFGEMLLKVRSDLNTAKKENELLAKDFSNENRVITLLKDSKENFDDNKKERNRKRKKQNQNDTKRFKNIRKQKRSRCFVIERQDF